MQPGSQIFVDVLTLSFSVLFRVSPHVSQRHPVRKMVVFESLAVVECEVGQELWSIYTGVWKTIKYNTNGK